MAVGYVGLGAMGRVLAGHLVTGHDLLVWDLNPRAIADFAARGAGAAASLRDMGERCDIVLLCLPKSANVEAALFGEGGLAEALPPGAIVIDQTSGVPAESRRFASALAARGIAFIDAPVAGGVPSAIAGQITIMASGPQAAFDKALPVLGAISPKVYHCSAQVGDGQAMKAINNLVNAAYRVATLEILAVGCRLGLSPAAITDALNAGAGRSFVTQRLLPAVVEQRSSADFALALMVKDLNQAAQLGIATATPMPISDTARGVMNGALNLLGADARLDDIVPFMEKLTATAFVDSGQGPADPARAMVLVTGAAAACNRAIMLENIALAERAGLDLARIAPVVAAGSASSAQAERLFAARAGAGDDRAVPSIEDLTAFTTMAAELGVPLPMTNQVRAHYLARGQD